MSATATLAADGRVWFRAALAPADLAVFDQVAATQDGAGHRLAPGPALARVLAPGGGLGRVVGALGAGLIPVRVVVFSKTEAVNWSVPWHQDRVITVQARHDLPGFGNWSLKRGLWHCEPPPALLDAMVFVRVHLDDAGPAQGAMRLARGSHRFGPVPAAEARARAETCLIDDGTARRGDVLAAKMLTLHASPPASDPAPRRAFRIDYAPAGLLPAPLAWPDIAVED